MKVAAIALALLTCVAVSAKEAQDKTVLISATDSEMNAAMQKARASMDYFLKISANPPAGASGFKIKVRFKDKHGTEYMWLTPFKQEGNKFIGTLADVPDYVTHVSHGQKISFTRADISDWGYVQNGRQMGSFTACVIFKHMPQQEVEMYRQQYGFEC